MQTRNSLWICAGLIVNASILMFAPADCQAQAKVNVDEQVKVQFLGSWHDGVVVAKDKKGKMLVEYEWAGKAKREAFDRPQIRKLCEVEAVDYARNWQSAEGTFRIVAALKDAKDGSAILITEELDELTVELSKLSKKDNTYVAKMIKGYKEAVARGNAPASIGKLPELESFSTNGSTMSTLSGATSNLKPLGALPSYLREFKQSGVGFDVVRPRQELVAAIPVGGPEQLVLMTAREDNFFNKGVKFQSQLYWISMKTQSVVAKTPVTNEDFAIDYDPRNKLLLTFSRKGDGLNPDDEDHYTIWKLPVAGETATPLVRWRGKGVGWSETLFGKIINDHIVITKTERHKYVAWDFVEKKKAYTITTESFFDAPVVLSHDRNSLIVPEDGRVTVLDAGTGKVSFNATIKDRHCSAANINPAGDKLAGLTERNLYVWDLSSGSREPTVYPAPLIGSPFRSRVEWIGDDHVLGESHTERILYSLKLKLPVWSYRMDSQDYWLNKNPLMNLVVDGKIFYVARPWRNKSLSAIGVVDLPGPSVEEVTANIDPASLLILTAGSRVGLSIGSVTDPGAVRQWLTEKIAQNEWVLDDASDIRIHAEMGIGETQSIEYEQIGTGNRTTVSFQPHYANLKIKQGNTVIWQTGTSTGAPPFISGRGSVQEKISSYQNPQLEFFRTVKIANDILDPKYSRGFGVSKLGRRGLEVVSTSPPGREDDPEAAAQKAEEDQQKARDDRRNQGGDGN